MIFDSDMKLNIPEHVSFIIERLKENGFDGYAVGGCVRDSFLGREPNDWDITTDAKPEQIKEIFGYTIDTGIQHGTVTVMLEGRGYEVTTYRIDGEYEDARHPKSVTFTANLKEDLLRRDFTINAMAYNHERGVVDMYGGLQDMADGIIRCVGNAHDRFTEDALRMLRAVRFAAQLGFDIDDDTYNAIKDLAGNLKKISAERIQAELVKLIASPHPEKIRLVYETGMADIILPEFSLMMETEQYNPHHIYSVGEHTIAALENSRPDKVLRLALLFHDVAKPECKWTDEDGIDHFTGHPARGAEMAGQIMRRLKFDNDTTRKVKALIKAHDDNPPLTERNVRRAIVRNGIDIYPMIFELKEADVLGQSEYRQQDKLAYADDYRDMYNYIMEKEQCLTLKDLAVKGADLIAEGVKPGQELGRILQAMLEDVLEDPSTNTREFLINSLKKGRYSQ